jgi:hypothetical protein
MGNSSDTWESIWEVRSIIQLDSTWRLGNVQKIHME